VIVSPTPLGARRDVRVAAVITGGSTAGDMAAQAALTLRLHDDSAGWPFGAGWAVAALLLANSVPALLCVPLAGQAADRCDSRRTLLVSGLLCAVLCTGLAFARQPWWLLALVAGIAAVSSTATATLGALLPVMAGRAGVVRAGTVLRGAVLIGGVTGLAAGASASASVGVTTILLLDAVTFAVLGVGATAIQARRGGPRRSAPAAVAPVPEPPVASVGSRRRCWQLTAGYAVVLLLVSTTNVAQVFFVKDTLGASNVGYGLVSACWTVGTAAALPLVRRASPEPDRLVMVTLFGELVVGMAITGCAVTAGLAATAACYVLAGAGACAMQIAWGAVLALSTPEDRRGRQLAGYNAVVRMAASAALGVGGLLLAWVGPRGVYLVSGAGSVLVAVLAGLIWTGRAAVHRGKRPVTYSTMAPIDPNSMLCNGCSCTNKYIVNRHQRLG
jgi:MFS family permease